MADNETIADIIAEARDKYTVHECNQCTWRKCCSHGFGSEKCGKFRESIFLKLGIEDGYFTQLLDRLEAAWKRERGDCAKLREALGNSNGLLEELAAIGEWGESAREQIAENNAALAAPPRNCDEYTSLDEARNAYMAINEMPEGNRDEDMRRWLCDFHHWLFAPATEKEGGNDGNE